jgi:hypothetical protein
VTTMVVRKLSIALDEHIDGHIAAGARLEFHAV